MYEFYVPFHCLQTAFKTLEDIWTVWQPQWNESHEYNDAHMSVECRVGENNLWIIAVVGFFYEVDWLIDSDCESWVKLRQ